MGDWPLYDGQITEVTSTTAASSKALLVNSHASANTKGSWTELIASTARPATSILVEISQGGTTVPADLLVDVAIGASSSEQIIIPDLTISNGSSLFYTRMSPLLIPFNIPAGTRIAARCQSSWTSDSVRIQVTLQSGGWNSPAPLAVMTAYGVNTADSGATSIDPGGSANTKGSWVQITSSTTRDTRALILGTGNQGNQSRSNQNWLVDIATGGSGSERVIIADQALTAGTNDDLVGPSHLGPFAIYIPSGTRIAARAQCSLTDATDRLFDLAVYTLD